MMRATAIEFYPLDWPLACGSVFDMNRETILKQLRRPGPLVVRTSDGERFPVPHPEFIFVGRFNVAIEDEAGAFDVIDPLHIVSIRPAPRPKQRKNGH